MAPSDGLDRETLRQLSRRSDARGLLQLCAHCLLLAATGTLVWAARSRAWLIPAMLVHGVVLNFVFCALHEAIHRTAFASRRLNDAVAWIAGAILLLPPEYFRAFHFAHHRFTQDAAHDPELAEPPSSSLASFLWRASGVPNWTKRISVTLRHALTGDVREPFVTQAKRRLIVRETRILWGCYGAIAALSIAFKSEAALIYWVLPALLGQPFLRLYLLPEHAGCAASEDMYANTRTTYTNGAVRLLAWQMPYHTAHHAFPAIPFHSLARADALIRGRIRVCAPGYFAVHAALIRQLRPGRAIRQPD